MATVTNTGLLNKKKFTWHLETLKTWSHSSDSDIVRTNMQPLGLLLNYTNTSGRPLPIIVYVFTDSVIEQLLVAFMSSFAVMELGFYLTWTSTQIAVFHGDLQRSFYFRFFGVSSQRLTRLAFGESCRQSCSSFIDKLFTGVVTSAVFSFFLHISCISLALQDS